MSASHKINQVDSKLTKFMLEVRQGFTELLKHQRRLTRKFARVAKMNRILKVILIEKGIISNDEIQALLNEREKNTEALRIQPQGEGEPAGNNAQDSAGE